MTETLLPTPGQFPTVRLRRNRRHQWTRDLVAEQQLRPSDLIWPVFVHGGTDPRAGAVDAGVHRYSLGAIVDAVGAASNSRSQPSPSSRQPTRTRRHPRPKKPSTPTTWCARRCAD